MIVTIEGLQLREWEGKVGRTKEKEPTELWD